MNERYRYEELPPEVWRRLDGYVYHGHLEVSDRGNVRHVFKNSVHTIKPRVGSSKSRGGSRLDVHTHMKCSTLARMVWEAFKGKVPDGMVVAHKNGLWTDNCIWNLELKTREQVGKSTGWKHKNIRSVVHFDKNYNVIEIYPTVNHAARGYGFLSGTSIMRRCKHITKPNDVWLDDGTSFLFEDDFERELKSIRKANACSPMEEEQ